MAKYNILCDYAKSHLVAEKVVLFLDQAEHCWRRAVRRAEFTLQPNLFGQTVHTHVSKQPRKL